MTQPMGKPLSVAPPQAEVGDDVLGDDPTVRALEAAAGKPAALLVPSGTMGNLIAVLAHCHERGAEVIVGDESHVYVYEAGGMSARPWLPAGSFLCSPGRCAGLRRHGRTIYAVSYDNNDSRALVLRRLGLPSCRAQAAVIGTPVLHVFVVEKHKCEGANRLRFGSSHIAPGRAQVLGGVAFNVVPTLPSGELSLARLTAAVRCALCGIELLSPACSLPTRTGSLHTWQMEGVLPVGHKPQFVGASAIVDSGRSHGCERSDRFGARMLRAPQRQAPRRPDDMHCARTALVCIENTHNRCGGAVLSLDYMASLGAWARERARRWLPCRCCACPLASPNTLLPRSSLDSVSLPNPVPLLPDLAGPGLTSRRAC